MAVGDIDALLQVLVARSPALRAAGVEQVQFPDGLSFRLSAAAPAPTSGAAAPSPPEDEDDADPVAEAQREERTMRGDWDAYWKRVTASSGAAIPAFPGVVVAKRSMAALRPIGRGRDV